MKTNLFQFTTASDRGAATVPRTTLIRRIASSFVAAALGAAMALGASTARASDPIGIYALVDKVVLEPSEAAPERIQIWGAFAFAVGYDFAYEKPKRGFLYYKLDPDKKATCLKEWADLKSVAGTNQVVGFAARHRDKGTVRKADAKPANPDTYPLGFGVTKVRDQDYEPVRELLKLVKPKASNKAAADPKSPAPAKRTASSERKSFRAVNAVNSDASY